MPEYDCKMIVSKQVNHADTSRNERSLRKKRIFTSDNSKENYISLELANVDIRSQKSILNFCDKYGLPYSSQLCYDREMGIGPDIESDLATKISIQNAENDFFRKDTMDFVEFCRHAVFVRCLLELKTLLDCRDKMTIRGELIRLLTYFVFYSREFIYNYDASEQQYPDILPKSRIMNFQYCFQWFRQQNAELIGKFPPAHQIVLFMAKYEYQLNHPESVPDPTLLSDINAEENRQVLKIFKRIFLKTSCQAETSQKDQPPYFVFNRNQEATQVLTNVSELKNVKNPFHVDMYNCITFDDTIDDAGDLSELVNLGYAVIRDVINEGLTRIMPQLVLDGRKMRGEWQLDFQLEGIYMELFFQMTSDTLYHRCENPKCNNYFVISEGRATKKYCCDGCGAACRQARRRMRNKESKHLSEEDS